MAAGLGRRFNCAAASLLAAFSKARAFPPAGWAISHLFAAQSSSCDVAQIFLSQTYEIDLLAAD